MEKLAQVYSRGNRNRTSFARLRPALVMRTRLVISSRAQIMLFPILVVFDVYSASFLYYLSFEIRVRLV